MVVSRLGMEEDVPRWEEVAGCGFMVMDSQKMLARKASGLKPGSAIRHAEVVSGLEMMPKLMSGLA